MLAQVGVLTQDEANEIRDGLENISTDLESGVLNWHDAPDEDIHSFVERNLRERIGAVAGKLHTGRSRNDQIALDVRLYLKDALSQTHDLVLNCKKHSAPAPEEHFDAILPGYTHLQRAQPVLLSHHLLAYFWMLQRDRERLQEAYRRANVLPLGSAALAGTTFPIDRHYVAQLLGFASVSENSMDTVADRDHLIESVSALSIIGVHLSRLAEEFVIWSAPEWVLLPSMIVSPPAAALCRKRKTPIRWN
jgi:argininosuccinate lyase